MNDLARKQVFCPEAPDAAGVISWVHVGDLHMTRAGEKNHRDLAAIVDEVNAAFAEAISFVYLPGDIADDGSAAAYEVVRGELDRLRVPWCGIVGDHDVHEKSFGNFRRYISDETRYAFTVGGVRFVAMNAFDVPDPGSFAVLPEQMDWLESELDGAVQVVVLLHCYPSDLKQGGERLRELVARPNVRLVEMGHTHYNEVANDGGTLYAATRSTGQIEEGEVGFSVTNLDGGVVSWKFLQLGELPAVMITSPADERLMTDAGQVVAGAVRIRAKAWGEIVSARAEMDGKSVTLARVADSQVWEGGADSLDDGVYPLRVTVRDAAGGEASDEIRVVVGRAALRVVERAERDQDNAVEAWPERGLLGTQLGPNKNGRKW